MEGVDGGGNWRHVVGVGDAHRLRSHFRVIDQNHPRRTDTSPVRVTSAFNRLLGCLASPFPISHAATPAQRVPSAEASRLSAIEALQAEQCRDATNEMERFRDRRHACTETSGACTLLRCSASSLRSPLPAGPATASRQLFGYYRICLLCT